MRATTSGCEIVCPAPIGSGMFSHASSRRSGGTKRSRGTSAIAASTRSSSTWRRSVLHQPLRGGRHQATLAPAARTASSARAESSGSTSTPRVAVLSTVTAKPSRSASSAVFLTQ